MTGERFAIHAGKSFGPGGWRACERWMKEAAKEEDHREWMVRMGILAATPVMRGQTPLEGVSGTILGPMKLAIPQGVVLATVKLERVFRTESIRNLVDDLDYELGDFSGGRYAWLMTDLAVLTNPVPLQGAQGLFNVPADIERAIHEQEKYV